MVTLGFVAAPAAAQDAAVLGASEADAIAVRHLRALIGPGPTSPRSERFTVRIDTVGRSVAVFTTGRAPLRSELTPETTDSPYAVALAASELLAVARDELSRGPESAPEPEPEPATTAVRLALGAEVSFNASEGDPWLIQPALQLDLLLGRRRYGPAALVGVSVAGLGRWSGSVADAYVLEHARTDLVLRTGAGLGLGDASVWVHLRFGLAVLAATLTDAARAQVGESADVALSLGLGAEWRQELWQGLGLGAAVAFDGVLQPTRYLVGGAPELVDGPVRLSLIVFFSWEIR